MGRTGSTVGSRVGDRRCRFNTRMQAEQSDWKIFCPGTLNSKLDDGGSGRGLPSGRSFTQNREVLSLSLFNSLNPSVEGRTRRRVAILCGLLIETLLLAAAALICEMTPVRQVEPAAPKHYQLTWVAIRLPAKPPAPKLPRIIFPQVKPPETPTLPAPIVAELEVPKVRPPVARIAIPQPILPAPPPVLPSAVATATPKPKEPFVVHIGTFGGASLPVTTSRPVQQVQTGGIGSPQGFAGQARGNSLGNVPKLGSFCFRKVGGREMARVALTVCKEWWQAPDLAAG